MGGRLEHDAARGDPAARGTAADTGRALRCRPCRWWRRASALPLHHAAMARTTPADCTHSSNDVGNPRLRYHLRTDGRGSRNGDDYAVVENISDELLLSRFRHVQRLRLYHQSDD